MISREEKEVEEKEESSSNINFTSNVLIMKMIKLLKE